MFSKFFINRPIFATVLALIIVVAGLVTLNILPVAQFPEITPPTVQVSAFYPGANAETVAQTVGIPIEQQVNGVDGMLYMSSTASSSGAYSLTITFAVGTDIDMATVQVQNRVSVAQSSLPEPVVVQGVTVQKQSSNIVMFLTMQAKDSVYDGLYLTNYAQLNLVDQLTRVPGVGAVNVMGAETTVCVSGSIRKQCVSVISLLRKFIKLSSHKTLKSVPAISDNLLEKIIITPTSIR